MMEDKQAKVASTDPPNASNVLTAKTVSQATAHLMTTMDKTPAQVNKRRNIRVRPDKNLPLRVDIIGDNFVEVLYAKNISLGGVGVFVSHGFKGCEIDKPVRLVMQLPEPYKQPIELEGHIRHVSAGLFGVSFSKMTRKEKAHVREYIRYRLANESWLTRLLFKLRLC